MDDEGVHAASRLNNDDSERDTGPNALECDDTVDNDGDGATDFPGDTGCSSGQDADET